MILVVVAVIACALSLVVDAAMALCKWNRRRFPADRWMIPRGATSIRVIMIGGGGGGGGAGSSGVASLQETL